MKAVFILADSLNRRFLPAYGAQEPAVTPNLDRLCEKACIFENHWVGSAPCMPARRDIMTGRYNFLERPWGGIEPYDYTLQRVLGKHGIYSRMETDHYCYSVAGGENYWKDFSSWQLHRGQQCDKYQVRPGKEGIREEALPKTGKGYRKNVYDDSRRLYHCSDDYPTPRTFSAAARWLEENHEADRFLLWAEGFDPHEPFDVPEEYLTLYEDDYQGPELYWPGYEKTNGYTPQEIHHLRTRYKALVTMTDQYIGKILDVMDRYEMWKDTMVIVTTDHGYLLGEHGYWAKNYMPDYNELMHIPLLVYHPDAAPRRLPFLTQNIDVFPTILEYFGLQEEKLPNPIHGRSWIKAMRGECERVRDYAIFGMFGKSVNITDGTFVYQRNAVREDNMPLFIYGSTLTMLEQYIGYDTMKEEDFSRIELTHLPWTKFPVYKIPADAVVWDNDSCYFHYRQREIQGNKMYNIVNDYTQQHPIKDEKLERQMIQKLKECMAAYDAPPEQYQRLGI